MSYNYYGNIQLKVLNDVEYVRWNIGDGVLIPDGIYLTNEGIVVIHDNILVAILSNNKLFNREGKNINIKEIVRMMNPIYLAMKKWQFNMRLLCWWKIILILGIGILIGIVS